MKFNVWVLRNILSERVLPTYHLLVLHLMLLITVMKAAQFPVNNILYGQKKFIFKPNVLVLNFTLSKFLKLRCVDSGLSSVLTP